MNDLPVPALPVMKMFLLALIPDKILICSALKTSSFLDDIGLIMGKTLVGDLLWFLVGVDWVIIFNCRLAFGLFEYLFSLLELF